jgi:hypothetical protein
MALAPLIGVRLLALKAPVLLFALLPVCWSRAGEEVQFWLLFSDSLLLAAAKASKDGQKVR